MTQSSSIRVSVRFRPMNDRESKEAGNHVCVKISPCGRACQVIDPKHPEAPVTRYFDQIYGPGSTQEELYEYTGKPLVEAMKQGFNATIFAYGQTGSGKTWSMVGCPGTEKRGLQPRVIEDVFHHIDEVKESGSEDTFQVHISMVEIYLEKVNDLFNAGRDGQDMKIYTGKKGMVSIQGVQETECHTVEEVNMTMERGFNNRATSATSMNKESSRSHCITILKVTRVQPDGTQIVSQLKMVDLAGSEKIKKTDASGQRLEEAKAINLSLTALNQCLNSLTGNKKSKVHHINFRDSKLTQLLQDSLGGNAKTSLIVAASPCSFNVEETISSLRFGEAAKKVKCNAKINKDRTIADYQKENKRLIKENGALTYENELHNKREAALLQLLGEKGHASEGQRVFEAVRAAAKPQGGDEKEEELNITTFETVSSKVLVINKETGECVAGDEAALQSESITSRNKRKQAHADKHAAENNKLASIAAALIRQGDYKALGEALKGKVTIGGSTQDLDDQLHDLRMELRAANDRFAMVEDQLSTELDRNDALTQQTSALEADRVENSFYKRKAEFLEKQYEFAMATAMKSPASTEFDAVSSTMDMSFLSQIQDADIRAKVEALAAHAERKDAMLQKIRDGGADFNAAEILGALKSGDNTDVLKRMLKAHKAANMNVREANATVERLKRQTAMLLKRDTYNKQLQSNWKLQLTQMEQAVLLCGTIQKRDARNFANQLKEKDEQLQKLKAYLAKADGLRRPKASVFGPGRIKSHTGSRLPRRKKQRPSRNLHTEAALPMSPRS